MVRYDPNATRTRILDAAEEEFLAHGYAGTSIGRIAEAAQASKGLIVHHFQTKENLSAAVLERIIAGLKAARGKAYSSGTFDGSEANLRAEFASHLDFARSQPNFRRLLFWLLKEDVTEKNEIAAMIAKAEIARVAAAQMQQNLRSDIDPELITLAFVCCLDYWIIAQDALKRCGIVRSNLRQDEFADALAKIFSRGLAPHPKDRMGQKPSKKRKSAS